MRGNFTQDRNTSLSRNNNGSLRVFVERRCVAPLADDDDDDEYFEDSDLQSMSYSMLPQTRLRLSVLKLDGSLFDIHVTRNATVRELKQAVEDVFTLSPKEDQGKISWTHVWGHFCLCYEGRKLLNDKAYIRDLRIQDGDQLRFIRHMSIDYLHSKRRTKFDSSASTRCSISSSGSESFEDNNHAGIAGNGSSNHQDDSYKYFRLENVEEIPVPQFKLAHFLRGWLSYSRLRGVSRKGSEGKSRPSRFALHCLGGSPRMIQL